MKIPLLEYQVITSSGDTIGSGSRVCILNSASALAVTGPTPAEGDLLVIVGGLSTSTTDHTVTLPSGVTWDGTNDVATFGDNGDMLMCVGTSATRWQIVQNTGSVAFS